MSSYTLHVPKASEPGDPGALERAVLVKDGFVWGAFVFSFLWFLVNRLWLAAAIVLAAETAVAVGARLLDANAAATLAAELALGVLIGLEASSLQRWTYARQGRPAVDVVVAPTLDDAEMKAFSRWLGAGAGAGPAAPRPPRAPVALPPAAPPPVIGLFPEAEARR